MYALIEAFSEQFTIRSLYSEDKLLEYNMGFEIKDKVAIITGGASGLGFEYVKEFLRNGLKVLRILLPCINLFASYSTNNFDF